MPAGSQEDFPECPVCLCVLGARGGPCTLPCSHNGCLECFRRVVLVAGAARLRPKCPLCREPFSRDLKLRVNTVLRDLLAGASPSALTAKNPQEEAIDAVDEFPDGPEVCPSSWHAAHRFAGFSPEELRWQWPGLHSSSSNAGGPLNTPCSDNSSSRAAGQHNQQQQQRGTQPLPVQIHTPLDDPFDRRFAAVSAEELRWAALSTGAAPGSPAPGFLVSVWRPHVLEWDRCRRQECMGTGTTGVCPTCGSRKRALYGCYPHQLDAWEIPR